MSVDLFEGIRPLSRRSVVRDVIAGLNVAAINIPQVLGYARIAGMPVVTGLYTVLLPLIGFAVFGSSRHLVVAADSATAAIFSSSLSHQAASGTAMYMTLVSVVALITGVFLLVARIFRLGFLADFLSRTVLAGFLSGVGLQVAIAMLGDMFGIPTPSRFSLVRAWQILQGLRSTHLPTLGLASLVAVAILLGHRHAPRLPLALLAVVGTIVASAAFHLTATGIAVLGPVPGGLPALGFAHVTWSDILSVVPVSVSCVVMIIAQSAATSRAFSERYQERSDVNADILGLSAANLAAAFSGTFTVNGSPTQTSMADRLGARSQVAQLTLAAVVTVVLLTLTAPLQYLPRCVLAAIVFTIAVGMVDVSRLRDIRRQSPGEFNLALVTAATVVAVGVEQGILLAIMLSLFMHVRHSYLPHTMMLAPDASGAWISVSAVPGRVTEPGLIVYRFGADLFYANEGRFVTQVQSLVKHAAAPIHSFVIDAGAITDIDYSAALAIRELLDTLAAAGVRVIFGRVTEYLHRDLDRHGITAAIGEAWIFPTLHQAVTASRGTTTLSERRPDY